MRPWTARGTGLGVLALVLFPTAIALASSPRSSLSPQSSPSPQSVPSALSASVSASELDYGAALTVSGRLSETGQSAGAVGLTLQADPYPYRGFSPIGHAQSEPDGSFAFAGVRPDRNTRLRVLAETSPAVASTVLAVTVDPAAAVKVRTLGPGMTRLTLRVHHTPYPRSAPVSVWWFLAARGTRVFRLAAVTSTRELSPELTFAIATVDPPSKRFVYRVCLNPAWERAMGPRPAHRPCPSNDFTVAHDVR
jgi:hypothetical protein